MLYKFWRIFPGDFPGGFFWALFWGRAKGAANGVVRRNGCPKGCFWRVRFLPAPLRFSGPFRCFKRKPYGGREETDSPKTPFWTTVSPHDPFAAPLARPDFSHKNEEKKSGEKIREKIRRLKNKNPRKIRSAESRP